MGNKREGLNQIKQIVHNSMSGILDPKIAINKIKKIEEDFSINKSRTHRIVRKFYETIIDSHLDNKLPSKEQENAILEFINEYLSDNEINKKERYKRLIKTCVIRDIVEGDVPNRVKIDGLMPFNFQKNEKIVWLFNPCEFHQIKTETIRKGKYSGISVKIANGFYYRTGGFTSNPVTSESVDHIATGLLAITNKNMYFYSERTSFRIPLYSIITFTPYKDGIGIQKDTKERPFIFLTGDGWFTYNLLMNLSSK